MNRYLLTIPAALVLVLVAAPLSASATHPKASGIGTCNPETGLFDVVWTVTSDPGYDDTGIFTSASRLADQIVGKAVAGRGAAIDPKPVESVATSAPLSLTVAIQFSSHRNPVSSTGTATFLTPTCEIPLPEDREVPGDAIWADYDCEATDKTGEQVFTLYTYSRAVDGSVVESTSTRTMTLTLALTPEEVAAKDADPACLTPTPTPPVEPTLPVAGPEDAIPGLVGALGLLALGGGLLAIRKAHTVL